jgi:hypothetical protein
MPGVFLLAPGPVFIDPNQQTVQTNAAVSTSGSEIFTDFTGVREIVLSINVKNAPSGTLPTLTYSLQEIDPGDGVTPVGTSVTGAALTAVGTQLLTLPLTLTGSVQVSWAVTGAGASFTGVYATLVTKISTVASGMDASGVEHPLAVTPANTGVVAGSPALVVALSSNLPTTATLSSVTVNASSAGNNTLVTGVVGKTIRVFKVALVFSVGGTAIFQDGASTALTGPLAMFAGGSIVFDIDTTNPWFITSAGNGFVLNLAGGAAAGGVVYYTQS